LRTLTRLAEESGYLTAQVDAAAVARVHLFNHFYQAAVGELDLAGLIDDYCRFVIRDLGYDPREIPAGTNFVDWAGTFHGRVPVMLRREVRERLERDLFRNKLLNRSFATVVLQLAAEALGAAERQLAPEERALLFAWIRGEPVLLREMRRFHVFTRADRYNARLFLRSLVELARLAGKTGLFIVLDHLEVLLSRKETGRLLYSRAARVEFYESVRQLIDEIDMLHHLFIVLGFHRELVDNEQAGLKSYEALWLRIQSEIDGARVNLFRDFLDLDRCVQDLPA